MTQINLDELDHKIIDMLGRDARVSNRQIASDLGVTEGTIRARIKYLQSERLIQFTVVTDFRMEGSPNLVMMGIHADPSRVPALATELSRIPEINCVVVLLGRYSLMAMGLFTSLTQVNDLIRNSILPLRGVRDVETSVSMQNFKYDARLARITPAPAAQAGKVQPKGAGKSPPKPKANARDRAKARKPARGKRPTSK
jgi:Lrp/AsnC family transcriptional regulator, regulator for asnA, asnC and gidA